MTGIRIVLAKLAALIVSVLIFIAVASAGPVSGSVYIVQLAVAVYLARLVYRAIGDRLDPRCPAPPAEQSEDVDRSARRADAGG